MVKGLASIKKMKRKLGLKNCILDLQKQCLNIAKQIVYIDMDNVLVDIKT